MDELRRLVWPAVRRNLLSLRSDITALGALFPPVKAAGAVGRGLLRHLSPTGIVANATDSLIELPKDKQSEWDEMRHAQRVDQAV